MADEAARSQQYEYRANSNLVLNVDKSLIERRGRDEPTGEVLPITSHIVGTRMGDKYQRTKPKQLDETKANQQKKHKNQKNETTGNGITIIPSARYKGQSILSDDLEGLENIIYRPKTFETKQNYELILSFIQDYLGECWFS
jgi:pre-mRNA-splicing helicase BRR2